MYGTSEPDGGAGGEALPLPVPPEQGDLLGRGLPRLELGAEAEGDVLAVPQLLVEVLKVGVVDKVVAEVAVDIAVAELHAEVVVPE